MKYYTSRPKDCIQYVMPSPVQYWKIIASFNLCSMQNCLPAQVLHWEQQLCPCCHCIPINSYGTASTRMHATPTCPPLHQYNMAPAQWHRLKLQV